FETSTSRQWYGAFSNSKYIFRLISIASSNDIQTGDDLWNLSSFIWKVPPIGAGRDALFHVVLHEFPGPRFALPAIGIRARADDFAARSFHYPGAGLGDDVVLQIDIGDRRLELGDALVELLLPHLCDAFTRPHPIARLGEDRV